ncbi:MAG: SURF1 family protein [Devosiaceae bacterium]|nr:SURF1 family protein [Devosiaceae bacterium]
MSNAEQSGSDIKKAGSGNLGFIFFMLALTALFAFLGNWQVNRLQQKEALISAIEQRIDLPPASLPPIAEWVGFDPEIYDFRPLSVTGRFDHTKTVRVFTALEDANGSFSGPGYWIVAPLKLEGGGVLFVNRGFVPENQAAQFVDGGAGPTGVLTITGIARMSEEENSFTPGADFENKIEWVRNVERLSLFLDLDTPNILPIYLNADAGELGALPQGGETKLTIINRHFEYALTWYSLALLTPILILFWWLNARKKPDGK